MYDHQQHQDGQQQDEQPRHGQGSPNPELSLYFVGRFIQQFRRNVNNATSALLESNMLNEEAAGAMICILDSNAAAASIAVQQQLDLQTDEERSREHLQLIRSLSEGLKVEVMELAHPIPKPINPFVFCHPYLIAPFRDASLAEASETVSSLAAVALYNCALARHTRSFQVADKDQEKTETLQQAKLLYQQAIDMMDSLKTLVPDGTLIEVYLACCNNLAEVTSALGQDGESKEWQDILRRSLWAVPPALNSAVYNHFVTAVQTYDLEVLPMADDPLSMLD